MSNCDKPHLLGFFLNYFYHQHPGLITVWCFELSKCLNRNCLTTWSRSINLESYTSTRIQQWWRDKVIDTYQSRKGYKQHWKPLYPNVGGNMEEFWSFPGEAWRIKITPKNTSMTHPGGNWRTQKTSTLSFKCIGLGHFFDSSNPFRIIFMQ